MQSDYQRLVQAIETGDVDAVASLLRELSSTKLERPRVQGDDREPLVQLAVRLNRPEILDMLLSHEISSNHESSENQSEDDDAQQGTEYRGRSPLCVAVELDHDDCARVLLAHDVSVDAPSLADGSLHTPLHVAGMFDSASPFFYKVILPSSSAIDARDMNENTPLHLAAAYGSYDVARGLLENGADVNAFNASGSTPLHLASSNGFAATVKLLLDHGADVNAPDVLSNTPLIDAAFVNQSTAGHFACGDATSQSRVIKVLLEHGADVEACNRDGNPAISGAVRNGYTAAVFALLDHGACVSKRNRNDETVLHLAARAGVSCVEIWTRLLVAGADVLARDRYDRTCYCIWISRPKTTVDEQPEEDVDNGERRTMDGGSDDPVTLVLEAAILTAL
jgi:ankyrin repeat protein